MLDKMKMKEQLIDELMSVLAGHESEMRLKPKAIMHEEIIAHPLMHDESKEDPKEEAMESPEEEDSEDGDEMDSRIKRYMRK